MRQSLGCRDSRHKCVGQELAAQSCRTRTLAMTVGGEGDWKTHSRVGGSEGLYWWRWELKQGFAGWSGHGCGRTGTQARLGGGECKVAFWLTPSPTYIEPTWSAEGSFLRLFAGLANLACWHSCIPKILKLN